MKKIGKSSWKKIIAVLCSVVLCTTAVTWPVDTVDAAAKDVTSITITLPESGITLVDAYGENMLDYTQDAKGYSDYYMYYYIPEQHQMKIIPVDDEFGGNNQFTKATMDFYAVTEEYALPSVEDFQGYKTAYQSKVPRFQECTDQINSSVEGTIWKITLMMGFADAGEISFTIKEGEVKYNVTYNNLDPDNCVVQDETDETLDADGHGSVKTYLKSELSEKIFKVKVTNPAKKPLVKMGNRELKSQSDPIGEPTAEIYQYSLSSVSADTVINVSTQDKTFTVDIQGKDDGAGYYRFVEGSNSYASDAVPYGGSYSFYVIPENGVEAPKVELISVGSGVLNQISENSYLLSQVTGNVKIQITQGSKKQVTVFHTPATGVSYYKSDGEAELDASVSVEYGTSHKFVVKPEKGYEITGVYANKQPFIDEETEGTNALGVKKESGQWTCNIKEVTEATDITVTAKKKMYTVTIEKGDDGKGYSIIEESASVEAGSSYELHISTTAGYGAPTITYKEKTQDVSKPLPPTVAGTYVIPSVNDDITITITSGEKNKYKVTFTPVDGVTYQETNGETPITGVKEVSHDDAISFKIKLDGAYSNSAETLKVLVDNVETKDKDGVYTIENVTEAHTVTVTGVNINKYNVTLPNGDGYTISTTNQTNGIEYGSTFKFLVKPDAGYTVDSVTYQENGKGDPKSLDVDEDGYYSIEITSNVTVAVKASKNKMQIESNTTEIHATLKSVEDGEIQLDNINYGDQFQFKVAPDFGYRVKQVDINGTPYNAAADGIYTVESVTRALKIVVTVELIKINLNYSSTKYTGKLKDLKKQITIEDVISSEKVDLPGPNDGNSSAAWSFQGWSSNDIEGFTDRKEINKNEIETLLRNTTADITINLTAKWVNAFKDLISSVKTNGSWSERGKDGKYTVTFTSVVEFADALKNLDGKVENDDLITVDAVGIIYANQKFETSKYEDAIKQAVTAKRTSSIIGDNLNLYLTCPEGVTLDLMKQDGGVLDTINIMLNKVSSYAGERYASGWIQLSAGGESVLVYCNEVATVKGENSKGENSGAIYK